MGASAYAFVGRQSPHTAPVAGNTRTRFTQVRVPCDSRGHYSWRTGVETSAMFCPLASRPAFPRLLFVMVVQRKQPGINPKNVAHKTGGDECSAAIKSTACKTSSAR
ncbi:hypothetical protein KCP77_05125 [Salmonella enterica subsp. enterica]|nr:hypothetical protein KCP77_05125 [Salmonella enterica subsp. enterica]